MTVVSFHGEALGILLFVFGALAIVAHRLFNGTWPWKS